METIECQSKKRGQQIIKVVRPFNQQFLLTVITVLLGCSVAIQGFFVAKVWEHENRLAKVETKIDLCNNTDGVYLKSGFYDLSTGINGNRFKP